jgi:flavodoxin I
MKSAVVYLSQSGQTEKVARAIAAALPGDVASGPIGAAPPLDDRDVVFVGMPIHSFGAPEAVREFLQNSCTGRRVALFITHASPEGAGPMLDEWLATCRAAAAGAEVVGCFDCQGELAAPVKDHMLNSGDPNLARWAQDDNSQGQPDEQSLERAGAFAREVAGRVSASD